jgi:diguanylate cyclase (GGDEF)-like protein
MSEHAPISRFKRIRYRVLATVVLSTLLPFAVLIYLLHYTATARSLEHAEHELQFATNAYAHALKDRLEFYDWSVRFLLNIAPHALSDVLHISEDASADAAHPDVTRIGASNGMLWLSIPHRGRIARVPIAPELLLYDVDTYQPGVARCVLLDGEPWRCAETHAGIRVLRAEAQTPLPDTFEGDIAVSIRTVMDADVAIGPRSWVDRLTPILIVAVYLLSVAGVLGVIRRRLAPIATLQRATRRLEQGDYGHRVAINSGDELELLGGAFNRMSARLATSFRKLQWMADMDRTILSANRPDEIFGMALAYCADARIDASIVLTGESQSGRIKHYCWRDARAVAKVLDQWQCSDRADPAAFTALVAWLRTAGLKFAEAIVLRDEIGAAGALLIHDADACSGPEAANLADLADRLSLALTHINRGHDLYRQAHFDPLTGLINRHAFRDRLGLALGQAERQGTAGAVLDIDLDRFKQVNDARGHRVGDQLLCTVATRIASGLRAGDTLARLGSNEFAVITMGSANDVPALCERLIGLISMPIVIDGFEHLVGASIGVAMFPRDGDAEEQLLSNASSAMHRVKAQGGSAFAFFDQARNREVLERIRIESRLRRAIFADELAVQFQPVYDLAARRVTSAEALLRWTDAELGVVEPGRFIPVAEDTGLLRDILPVLIRQSLIVRDLLSPADAAGFRFAINASPRELLGSDFARRFLEHTSARGADPSMFTLEITESAFIDDIAAVTRELETLRARGVLVSLDDFGTGFSSLNLLRRLPIDTIKIDRAFIAELTRSDEDRRLAQQIIRIARIFNRSVVAEGVTSPAEVDLLREFGCHCVQGFGISRPLSPDACARFVAEANAFTPSRTRLRGI